MVVILSKDAPSLAKGQTRRRTPNDKRRVSPGLSWAYTEQISQSTHD
jgi:hypothetical protein